MDAFKVGEVAIGHGFMVDRECNGMECVIVEPLNFTIAPTAAGDVIARDAYVVRWASGEESYVAPENLRKRRPPAADKSSARQAMLDCIERVKRPVEVEE